MLKVIRRILVVLVVLALLGVGGAVVAYQNALKPTAAGDAVRLKFDGPTPRRLVFNQLQRQGVIRNAQVMELWARQSNQPANIKRGSYSVKPGMTPEEVMKALESPERRMVRFREGWWIARTADDLGAKNLVSAEDYKREAADVAKFRREFDWIPASAPSLEGFLFPDTYDFPPGTTAEEMVREQLKTFEKRVLPKVRDRSQLGRIVNIAAMVEKEAAVERERTKIAGVIENRLRKGQNLEIDATVLYALGRWYELGPGVVRTVKHPYNTYLNNGLPPGPIGSPSLSSIEAAMNPDTHGYYYYVALPDRTHLFGRTYGEHLANIRRARAAAR